ncbi:degenerin mec-4-like, partial [Anneissia japonica]|uniref:degenerin mec-4-like n=1 Tax=Anneissia japonica TaxID=1529436 RepID=UPI00142577F2
MMSNKPSKDGEVLPIVHNLLKNSSSHGLPNIYSSRNVVAKLFWGMVFCAGLCLMFWQVYTLFEAYFAYEYIVGLEVRYNKTLPFPAVTICNLNPVLKSKLEEADEGFRDKFDSNYVPPNDKDTQDDKNNMVTSSSLTSATNDDGGSNQGTRMDGETTTQAVNTTEPILFFWMRILSHWWSMCNMAHVHVKERITLFGNVGECPLVFYPITARRTPMK